MIDHLYTSKTFLTWFGALMVMIMIFSCSGGPKSTPRNLNTALINSTNYQVKDAMFLVDAAEINMQEMQLGQLAQRKAVSADVRELGRRMERKHMEHHQQLIAIAKKLITLPTTTSTKTQAAYDKLNEKTNSTFDEAFSNSMVTEHINAIALFENAITTTHDQEIKDWAIATLSTLKSDLDYAIRCQKKYETF